MSNGLNISSCACRPCVSLLQTNVYSSLLFSFELSGLYFVVELGGGVFHIFWIYALQIVPPILWVIFLLYNACPLLCRRFNFDEVQIYLFIFLLFLILLGS